MKRPVLLYIDDDPEALNVLKIGLEDRGYTVLTALGGKDAYALLDQQSPDLIITDLRMSPVNGFDIFVELKKTPKYASMPFIFLTAVEDQFAQTYGRKLGVDAYLTKPVDIDRLDAIVAARLTARA
jgi:DNA-binding response OmpR family regulator